jgi:DNA-binding NarL/FixJ family response regulator
MNDRAMLTRLNQIDGHLRSMLELERAGTAATLEEALANSAAITEHVLFGGDDETAVSSPVVQRLLIASLQARVEARLLSGNASGMARPSVIDAIRRMKATQSVHTLERQLCIELRDTLGFDNALLSLVTADSFVPQTPDRNGGIGMPLPRVVCAAEQDCVRFNRFVCAGVDDMPAAEGFCELLGAAAYLVAPVVAMTKVVALVHVCRAEGDITDDDVETMGMLLSVYSALYGRMLKSAEVQELRTSIVGAAARLTDEAVRITGTVVGLGEEGGTEAVGADAAADVFTAALTNRERRVFELMVQGDSNPAIARKLNVALETVKTHVKRILRKTGAANRLEAIALYAEAQARTDLRGRSGMKPGS